MSSTEVSTTVPGLVDTPATTIGFEDITPPNLYVAQRSSGALDTGLVKYGDLFVGQGGDDPEPQVLRPFDSTDEGLLFIPLHMFKTWTWSDGENLRSWPYGDTGEPPQEATDLAENSGKPLFRTYNYVVYVPDYDPEMPVTFRVNSKSGRPTANKINLTVSRSGKPWHGSAFRLTTDKREKGANKWAVPVVTEAKATAGQHKQAEALYRTILPGLQARAKADAAAANTPAI